jgi:hypothetical protein
MSLRFTPGKLILGVLVPALLLVAEGNSAHAQRQSAASLLPDTTVAFVSVADTNELTKRFMQTALGRMSQQEKMKPLIAQVWREVQEVAAPLEDWIGLSLADLLGVPQGQITFAIVAPKREIPAFVGLLDVKEQIVAVEVMLEKADKVLRESEAIKTVEKVGETSIVLYKLPGSAQRQVAYFEREGTLVVGTNLSVLKSMLSAWGGERKDALALNTKYSTIMNRCRGSRKDRPQITWYLDPRGLVRSLTQNNDAIQFGLTLLEDQLGLKGLQAIGGSMTFATTDPAAPFDNISHVHILLDNPRTGAIRIFALGAGDAAPESFVPRDVAAYTTFHWQLKATYKELASIIDTFGGEGFTAGRVQTGFSRLGIDFEKEFLPALDNRFSFFNWVQKPVTAASSMQLFAIKLKDAEASRPLFEKTMARFEARFEKDTFGGKTYYRFIQTQPDPEEGPPLPRPCVALLGDYVLVSDRPGVMEQAIKTSLGQAESLAGAPDFRLIAEQAAKQAGGARPAMVSFNRPEEGMRFIYDLITGENNRRLLRRAAENNRFVERVNKALDDNPLPPFETLKSFLAPAGAVLIDEATGIHYIAFGLKAPE